MCPEHSDEHGAKRDARSGMVSQRRGVNDEPGRQKDGKSRREAGP
ncbi:MAG: hypothetical protein QMC82_07240 [Methanolinea sp.]|nr:hypothetical protein [Methanolinea sp.]